MKKCGIVFVLFLVFSCSKNAKQSSLSTWQYYLGDPERTHYSTLNQIDTLNVASLQLAWTYNSGGFEK